jgi:hypothetical protein
MKGCPASREAGSLTRNLFDGEGSTAAFGKRMAPRNPNSSAAAADHQAVSPRKSRRGISSGSKRERVGVGLGSVTIEPSFCCCASRLPIPLCHNPFPKGESWKQPARIVFCKYLELPLFEKERPGEIFLRSVL